MFNRLLNNSFILLFWVLLAILSPHGYRLPISLFIGILFYLKEEIVDAIDRNS